ncbi:MAG: hypothetical protein Q8O03_01090 [Nanoarchaeota archaeon]|nr:hypothetical protein [Nanoarchaeota archaeon]
MKLKEILRTIESHLELRPIRIPRIKVDPEYLKDMGQGATVEMEGEPTTVYLEKKDDLGVLAEELTHLADVRSGISKEVKCPKDEFYNCVLIEALGYYGSKLITPKREPIRNKGYKTLLGKLIKKDDWGTLEGIYYNDKQKFVRLWHEIGYDLGEKIYNYMQKTGDKEPALMLTIKNRHEKKPFETYKRILEQVTR